MAGSSWRLERMLQLSGLMRADARLRPPSSFVDLSVRYLRFLRVLGMGRCARTMWSGILLPTDEVRWRLGCDALGESAGSEYVE